MSNILNCPFCGSSASVRIDDEKQNLDIPNLVVACDNPKCQVYQKELHETFEEAIAAWNRRYSGSCKDNCKNRHELCGDCIAYSNYEGE